MGLFDYVKVDDDRFECSEGHDLRGEEFQTKDFGCTMGEVSINADGRIAYDDGGYGGGMSPDSDIVYIYCDCRKCPAFVQYGTGNLVSCSVAFRVRIDHDLVVDVKRISPTTADWIVKEPTEKWMAQCDGPMPFADALQLHRDYDRLRPDARAENDRRREERVREAEAKAAGRIK